MTKEEGLKIKVEMDIRVRQLLNAVRAMEIFLMEENDLDPEVKKVFGLAVSAVNLLGAKYPLEGLVLNPIDELSKIFNTVF